MVNRLAAIGLVTFAALMLPAVSARQPERSAPEAATFEVPGSRFIGLNGRAAEKTPGGGLRDRYDGRPTCGMSSFGLPLDD